MNNSEKSTTSNTKIIFAIALFAVALLLGIVGYMYTYEYEEGINKVIAVTDAFYDAFMFVTLNNSEHIKDIDIVLPKVLIWLSKFTALVAVALTAESLGFIDFLKNAYKKHNIKSDNRQNKRTVAVYSSEEEFEVLKEDYNRKKSEAKNNLELYFGGDNLVGTKEIVLLKDEDENNRFLSENKSALKGVKKYIRVKNHRMKLTRDTDTVYFSYEELAARLFWKQSDFYSVLKQKLNDPKNDKIAGKCVFIGFDEVIQEMLIWALQLNVFRTHDKQHIEYIVYGTNDDDAERFSKFTKVFHEVDRITDKVIYKDCLYYEDVKELEGADMIMICNREIGFELLSLSPSIDNIVLLSPYIHDEVDLPRKMKVFQYKTDILTLDNILQDETMKWAKLCGFYYDAVFNDHWINGIGDDGEKINDEEIKKLIREKRDNLEELIAEKNKELDLANGREEKEKINADLAELRNKEIYVYGVNVESDDEKKDTDLARAKKLWDEKTQNSSTGRKLDIPQIMSNIIAADYCELIKNSGVKEDLAGKKMDERSLDILARMEHENWMRCYFLLNWVPDGDKYHKWDKAEKAEKRKQWKHNCLFLDIFETGGADEKKKDVTVIKLILLAMLKK